MSFISTFRKISFGLAAVALICYGLTLYAQQRTTGLTPPPKPNPSQQSPTTSPVNNSSGTPFVVGERLAYNVSWSSFPSAARVEMEVAAQGQFFGQESYQLRTRVETLGQVRSLFGDIENQYTSYVSLKNAVPHRLVSSINQRQKRVEEITLFDQSKRQATFSDESTIKIPSETYDLTSLIYGLRLRQLSDDSKLKLHALYGKELIEVEAVIKGRERIVTQAGTYNAIHIKFYPKNGKYNDYRGYLWLSDDPQRLPVLIKARLSFGELRAELISVAITTRSTTPLAKLPPVDESGSIPTTSPGSVSLPSNGSKLTDGTATAASNNTTNNSSPAVERNLPFVVGERLNYDIAWGNFSSVGKASFEVRQKGMLGKNPVFEFFGEASSVGAARTLINVNDQLSSLAMVDTLIPVRTDLRLREGKRSKQITATYDWSKNQVSLSSGTQTDIRPSTYDLVSLFYAVRAADLKIGAKQDFHFLNANHRLQMLTIKIIKQESIGGPLGTRDALQIDVLAPEPAKILLAQVWISNDAKRLPLYLVTRTRFGELRFQLTSAVNIK